MADPAAWRGRDGRRHSPQPRVQPLHRTGGPGGMVRGQARQRRWPVGGCDQEPAAARIVIQVLELADGLALAADEATRIWPIVDPAPAKHTCPVPDAGPSMRQ